MVGSIAGMGIDLKGFLMGFLEAFFLYGMEGYDLTLRRSLGGWDIGCVVFVTSSKALLGVLCSF